MIEELKNVISGAKIQYQSVNHVFFSDLAISHRNLSLPVGSNVTIKAMLKTAYNNLNTNAAYQRV